MSVNQTPGNSTGNVDAMLLPAPSCIFCHKTISEVGGKRIIAQHSIGVTRVHEVASNVTKIDKAYHDQHVPIESDNTTYMRYWGPSEKWTEDAVSSAKSAYKSGRRPWFCQVCCGRVCRLCGSPPQFTPGADSLSDDGGSSHFAILPIPIGCINEQCQHHRTSAILKSARDQTP